MGEDHALSVRARGEGDLRTIMSWIPDRDALYLFSGARLDWPLTSRQLRTLTVENGLTPFVIIGSDGEIVGHFDLVVANGIARLGRVIIAPALRGRGLANAVVGFAIAEAGRMGATSVRLNVISSNTPAIRAYRQAGFMALTNGVGRPGITAMERAIAVPADPLP